MDWNAESVRERTKTVRGTYIEIEKERIKKTIEERVDEGDYCCKTVYHFDETIDWLKKLGFIVQHTTGKIVISWAPERVDNLINNPYA